MTSKYTLKNVKTFSGMEGRGFNASLYRDGKKVAEVRDDATGGPLRFDWADALQPKVVIDAFDYAGNPIRFNGSEEEKRLHDFCNALPQRESNGRTLRVDPDWYVSELVDTADLMKRVKRHMKTKVVIIEGTTISTISYAAGITPETLAAARKNNPKAVVLNGLSDAELAPYVAKALEG
ncbi:MAG: hypothetical protein AB1763_11060 [Campylobacterota bacterium]